MTQQSASSLRADLLQDDRSAARRLRSGSLLSALMVSLTLAGCGLGEVTRYVARTLPVPD